MGDGVCVNGVGSLPPIQSENKILVGVRITGTYLSGFAPNGLTRQPDRTVGVIKRRIGKNKEGGIQLRNQPEIDLTRTG